MKFTLPLFLIAVAALALPSAQVHSQALPPRATDPLTTLQSLLKTNEDLLKRQDATLKSLAELNTAAHEARIFTKRG